MTNQKHTIFFKTWQLVSVPLIKWVKQNQSGVYVCAYVRAALFFSFSFALIYLFIPKTFKVVNAFFQPVPQWCLLTELLLHSVSIQPIRTGIVWLFLCHINPCIVIKLKWIQNGEIGALSRRVRVASVRLCCSALDYVCAGEVKKENGAKLGSCSTLCSPSWAEKWLKEKFLKWESIFYFPLYVHADVKCI